MKQEWLKNADAAEALAVDVRTIKRWMRREDTREALSAVEHGKQWRIPRPNNISIWEFQARARLKELGIECKRGWERDLKKRGEKGNRYRLESYRLWLAAYGTALGRGRITEQARKAGRMLWQMAGEILDPLPRHEMQVDKLKSRFAALLLMRRFHEVLSGLRYCSARNPLIYWLIVAALLDASAVMRYWPNRRQFKLVRDAYTLDELEEIRRRLDYTQAVRDLKQLGQKPTAENIRPLLHRDMKVHINDTHEQLPGIVVKNPTNDEMHNITMASVVDQIAGKKPLPVTFDLRQPQDGLARRTVQKRHPQKKCPQKNIVAGVYQIRGSVPGTDEKVQTGKTPVRKAVYDAPSLATRDCG